MKTTTYLRLSLLIPFLVWGICLLLFIAGSQFAPDEPASDASTITALLLFPFLFYVFGIIGWFLPYLVLSFILLVLSFTSRVKVLTRVFALSPLAMVVLILAFVNVLTFDTQDWTMLSSNTAMNVEGFLGYNLLFLAVTLVWGYLCVGIGFGLYKLLQRLGSIRDEVNTEPVFFLHEPS